MSNNHERELAGKVALVTGNYFSHVSPLFGEHLMYKRHCN